MMMMMKEMREAGICTLHRGKAHIDSIEFVEPPKGDFVLWDNETTSGEKILHYRFSPTAKPFELYLNANITRGITVEVDTDCFIRVHFSAE